MSEERIGVPDSITPVAAWRVWFADNEGLWSLGHQMRWRPGVPAQATCTGMSAEVIRKMVRDSLDALIGTPRASYGSGTMYSGYGGGGFSHGFKPTLTEDKERIRFTLDVEEPADASVPSEHCSCGIYAATDRAQAESYSRQGGVLGRVALWGKVIVSERGYRGEFAYPQAFYVTDYVPGLHVSVLQEFGVPILEGQPGAYERAIKEMEESIRMMRATRVAPQMKPRPPSWYQRLLR